MSDVIQKWIANRIGFVMNMSPEIFASDVRDGTVLSRILRSYNIIGHEQFLSIVHTTNQSIAYKNLEKLRMWLRASGITCNEQDMYDISMCKANSAIKILYQLYLEVHDKDKLYFIAKTRETERLHPSETRFVVTPVEEPLDDPSDIPDHPLSVPLVLQQDVIIWNKNRYQTLLDDYHQLRESYTKYIHDKYGIVKSEKFSRIKPEKLEQPKIDELNTKFTSEPDSTYEELLKQERNTLEMEKFREDPKIAKKIVNRIKLERRRELKENEVKLHEQKVLLMELWEKLVKNQEKEFEESVSMKMLRQSLYEKQMATKMFEVREYKQRMLQNRRFVDAETLKKREDEFLENVFLREKGIGDQKYNYYFERDRVLELHRRIYAEKLRLKAERHFNMCVDIMRDLINVAIKHSEYKEQYNEPEVAPRVQTEWGNLFIKQQSIFDLIEKLEDIVEDTVDLPEDMEEIFCMEIHRQNKLDERDFENYFNLDWPWKLEDLLSDYEQDVIDIELGMNVLGHGVHRVLFTKYPKPKPPPKPKIPKVTTAVCINGLPDITILPVLQKLLDEKEIRIIQIQEAINYCLEAFNTEIRTEYKDTALVAETELVLEKPNGKEAPAKKGAKPDDKGTGKKPVENVVQLPQFAEKQVQTPIIYPCEEIVLSPKGELGKIAYDLMNIGEQLTDILIIAMFIEFLKTLKEIRGWALINYPTTFEQAVLLEEALTGRPISGVSEKIKLINSVSIGDISDLNYRESQWDIEEENARKRRSNLLPNPDPPQEDQLHKTYLTAYIHAQPKTEEKENPPTKIEEERKQPQLFNLNLDIDDDNVFEDDEEEIEPLEKFYMDQGCNYAFFYKTFEVATIKHLAKLIIGEYKIPPKTSLELFGDTVKYIEANLAQAAATPGQESKGDKKGEKPPKVTKVPADKSTGKDDKAGKAIGEIVRVDKETQIPELEPEIIIIYTPPPEPRAGEQSWRYSDISFPSHFEISLASLWENVENVYICDFKELCFIKRIILNAVVPYLSAIRRHMDIFIARPDDKQNHMHNFQVMYNEIDADLRDDEELKAEVHCRIAEFRDKLWEICDRRMRESEIERQRIIQENWVALQACQLVNNYITGMQLEIDRSTDTFQFLTDYYVGIITKMPSDEAPMQKSLLSRLEMGSTENNITSFGASIQIAINTILITPGSDSSLTPFHDSLEEVLPTAIRFVEKWKSSCLGIWSKMDALFKAKGKPPKDTSKKGKDEKKLPMFVEPDAVVKEAGPRLVEEWKCAINGETVRATQRLTLIKERGLRDLNDILNCSQTTFYNLFTAIKDRYTREINSVDTACEVLATATEAEKPLQPELVLDGDKFYVQRNILLFPDPLPAHDPPMREKDKKGVFTITQLDGFAEILMDLAPNGSIPERAFVFLLQDMVLQNAEDGKDPMVPLLWKKLQPNLISELCQDLFGDVEFLDWRDFIIYNLSVSFPDENELLEIREQFRDADPDATETVMEYQYHKVKFWFEVEFDDEDVQDIFRLDLTRKLLFKLFKINEDTVNYTSLLLAFCKDHSPTKGFAKALSLSIGKFVCWDESIGRLYMDSVREQKFLEKQREYERQLAHQNAVLTAESVVYSVIDRAVHACDSVIIEDYVSEENGENEFIPEETSEFFNIEEETDKGAQTELFMEEEFSNIDVSFGPYYQPQKVYFISFEVVLNVLTAALPWHARAQTANDESFRSKVEEIYKNARNPEFDNVVFTHELLLDRCFMELLLSNFKFAVKHPYKMVAKMVEESCGVCC